MKKVFLLLAILLTVSFTASAMNVNIQEDTFSFGEYVATFSAFVLTILPLTGWIKNAIGIDGASAQFLSWVTGFIVAFAAWFLNLGIFSTYEAWWQVALVGLFGTLAANGVFKTSVAQAFLAILKAK